jgi:hypothetical protein
MQKKNNKKALTKKPASKVKTNLPKPVAKKAVGKAPHYLFSVPSQHTEHNDYEHLVIAPDKNEACRLLAEHRVTEKRPEMEGEVRSKLVERVMKGYTERAVVQVEARKEAAGVVQVNHHKLGLASSLN